MSSLQIILWVIKNIKDILAVVVLFQAFLEKLHEHKA